MRYLEKLNLNVHNSFKFCKNYLYKILKNYQDDNALKTFRDLFWTNVKSNKKSSLIYSKL